MLHKTITINLGNRSYPIYIGDGLLNHANYFLPHIKTQQKLLITDANVAQWYLSSLQKTLNLTANDLLLLPEGEQHKSLVTVEKIWQTLYEKHHHRDTTLIALGGGVIGDMTGFAAVCYQRGVNFMQIPTTLLAQVDSSIGGKTGVNFLAGKNLLGAFHQPQAVIIDIATLTSLPAREFNAGLAEVIKAALIADREFFVWLNHHQTKILSRDKSTLFHLITKSCEIKAAIVASDEHEQGKRALLNFGHTFAHAIEASTHYQEYLHGEAVAMGMLMAARLSQQLNFITSAEVDDLHNLLVNFQLPVTLKKDIPTEQLLNAMQHDKKILNNQWRFVVLKAVGEGMVMEGVSQEMVGKAIGTHLQVSP